LPPASPLFPYTTLSRPERAVDPPLPPVCARELPRLVSVRCGQRGRGPQPLAATRRVGERPDERRKRAPDGPARDLLGPEELPDRSEEHTSELQSLTNLL